VIETFKAAKVTWLLLTLLSAPAIAHNVEIAGEIAGTWHIEPDHNPRAGEPAKVWVALTRKGGEILPLEQANCNLAVYSQPDKDGDPPILQPPLKAIAVEEYQGIPGTDVVFPAPGLYEMKLNCTPKTAGTFEAFEMQSEVTVAAGTAQNLPLPQNSPMPTVAQSPQNRVDTDRSDEVHSSKPSDQQGTVIFWAIPIVLGLGFLKVLSDRSTKS
jgi:hypothetical protein